MVTVLGQTTKIRSIYVLFIALLYILLGILIHLNELSNYIGLPLVGTFLQGHKRYTTLASLYSAEGEG